MRLKKGMIGEGAQEMVNEALALNGNCNFLFNRCVYPHRDDFLLEMYS